MKKFLLIFLVLCMVLSGCGNARADQTEPGTSTPETEASDAVPASSEATAGSESAVTVYPLPDSTMDTLDNAILAVSLEEGGIYVDDTGAMQMDVKVYTYDLFDMVDIAGLKAGDTIVTHSGEVKVTSVEQNESGTILINGGLEYGGFELFSSDGGVYYEVGYSDTKSWYEAGTVTLPVRADFEFRDNMDLEKGEQIYSAGSFLSGDITDYYFTPHNTTLRTENGQIVSMERFYTP